MNLKKNIGKLFTSKFVGTGPSSYKKRTYRSAVSQRLRNTGLHYTISKLSDVITSLLEENRHDINNVNCKVNKLRFWKK